MKKRLTAITACAAALLLALTSCGSGKLQTGGNVEDTARFSGSWEGMKLADGVSADMLRASYWTGENADSVIMTGDEISGFNTELLGSYSSEGKMYDLRGFSSSYSAEKVRTLIGDYELPGDNMYINGEKITASYIDNLSANRNLDALSGDVRTGWGIAVDRISARGFPTADFCSDCADDLYYDEFQQAEIYANEPVVVLHSSADGEWLYVLCQRFGGWVRSESVALCADRSEWAEWQNASSLLVVTGKSLTLDYDPYEPVLAGLTLSMGTRLPLAAEDEIPDSLDGRTVYGCYIVKVPVRAQDGSFDYRLAAVPCSADVSVGYPEYTRTNLLIQAFKMTGSLYGWGGMYAANDCSGFALQVYRCFGFELPRNSRQLAAVPGIKHDTEGLSAEDKGALLDKLEPGSLLYFPGHLMLYLGSRDGRYYVLSSLYSYVPADTADNPVEQVLTVTVNTLDVLRADGTTWLDNITALCTIDTAD